MYALRHRGQYDQAVASELDGLMSALRAWLSVDHNEDGTHNVAAATSTRMVGEMLMWGTNTAPSQWLLLNGAQVSRTTYQALFELWGTTYGAGDGSTTFTLPDLRQRVPMGKASSGTGSTLAGTGGTIDHTHSFGSGNTGAAGGFSQSSSSDGAHTHTVSGTTDNNADAGLEASAGLGQSVARFQHTHDFSATSGSNGAHTHTVTVSDHTHSIGSGTTGTGNMPYLVVNFIVFVGV